MDTPFFIDGPIGLLECLRTPGKVPQHAITAVLCHPHPLFAGTMHNKVITTLMQTCRDLGMDTVRFNFRGVGQSTGSFGNSAGELADCLAVIDWVKQHQPGHTLLLAGFSFGGNIAMRAAAQTAPVGLITVAPALYETAFGPITCPWIVVQGEQDEIINPKAVYQFLESRSEAISLIRLPQATHFFHGQLGPLKQQLTEAILKCDILNTTF